MAITKPEAMNFSDKNIIMIVSGLPGTGKTTLALSAPDVLLIGKPPRLALQRTPYWLTSMTDLPVLSQNIALIPRSAQPTKNFLGT